MFSKGWPTDIHQSRRTWNKPETKGLCEGVTLSLNPSTQIPPETR